MNASPSPNPYPSPIAPRFDLEDVVAELVKARRTIAEKSLAVEEAKLLLADRRSELAAVIRAKEEIEDELTDPTKRPLLAAIRSRPAPEASADEHQRGPTAVDVPDPPQPKRSRKVERADRREKKPVPWQDVALSEILPDDCGGADIIDKVAAHLELLEDRCPTVGDIALIWLSERDQPHTLEDLHSLTESERETLRSTLAGFRIARGWGPRVAMPDGFPLAWLRPEPTADIVIDPMAAAGRVPEPDEAAAAQERPRPLRQAREPKIARGKPAAVRGPQNQSDALFEATRLIPSECLKLTAAGQPSAEEIHRALVQWPAHRKSYDRGEGVAWAVVGGSQPRFWYDTAALDDFPTRKRPTLAGDDLVAAVRRVLKLRTPRKAAKPAGVES